jgi:hypothetical protein
MLNILNILNVLSALNHLTSLCDGLDRYDCHSLWGVYALSVVESFTANLSAPLHRYKRRASCAPSVNDGSERQATDWIKKKECPPSLSSHRTVSPSRSSAR